MQLNQKEIVRFKQYCDNRGWTFDQYTSEFTIQFRLCRYLESFAPHLSIELESNVDRYGIDRKYSHGEVAVLLKKEIDIDITDSITQEKTAIELKYLRDEESYDTGMFSICKDLQFLERLKKHGFQECYAVVFTSIKRIFTRAEAFKVRHEANLHLHQCFRNKLLISTREKPIQLISQTYKHCIPHLQNEYRLEWMPFTPTIQACLLTVDDVL